MLLGKDAAHGKTRITNSHHKEERGTNVEIN